MRNRVIATALAGAAVLGTAAVATSQPASAAADTCTSTTHYEGNSLGSLSNGTLYGGWCALNGTSTDIRRLNVGYKKVSGSGAQIVLGWELINCTATRNGGSWWSSPYNVSPGTTKEVSFSYSGGVRASSTYPCVRSKMKDNISGTLYWGKTLRLYG